MRVKIHRKGDTGGGGLTLSEDANNLPRLPEVGENIFVGSAFGRSKAVYLVESISWDVENTNTAPDTMPVYELTMNIHCQKGN